MSVVLTRRFWPAPCALSVLLWAGRAFGVSVSNHQPIIRQTLAPGEGAEGSIELVNDGEEPLVVNAYLEDWEYLPEGSGDKLFAAPGTLPRSSAGWVSFFPQRFELPAYGRAVVDYTVRVPQDRPLDGGYYAVLFFESSIGEGPAHAAADAPEVIVRFAARVGSLFVVDVKGTVRREARLSVSSVSPPSASEPMRLEVVLANEGNVSLSCEGSFHLMAPGELIVGRGKLPVKYLWPGVALPVSAQWSGTLERGDYTAVLTFDCGEELVVAEEGTFAVP